LTRIPCALLNNKPQGHPVEIDPCVAKKTLRHRGISRASRSGKHTIVFDFTYDGPGLGKSGTGVLKVDGREVRTLQIPKTIPFALPFNETFDVGADTRTGVNDQDYEVPFRFNGTIDKLTFNLGPEQLTAVDRKAAGPVFDAIFLHVDNPPPTIKENN
jgi:hypothetical protein